MKILIVDDDELMLRMTSMHLAKKGHETRQAMNAAEAINIFAKERDIDFLITDIVMPGDDGTKLIRQIRDIEPNIPVLAMTSGVENAQEDYVQLAEFFADCTLPKPFTKADLFTGMDAALNVARARTPIALQAEMKNIKALTRMLDRCRSDA